jgi:NMD protein affecting ribosome stability and mRNA decay
MICADCGKDKDLPVKTSSGRICRDCYNNYIKSMDINDRIINKKEKKGKKS